VLFDLPTAVMTIVTLVLLVKLKKVP